MGCGNTRVVIVGGRSRSGLAIRSALAGHGVTGIVRGQAGRGELAVADYLSPPQELDLSGAVVINCAGAVDGSPADLMQANRDVALAWAQAAAQGGAKQFVQVSSFSLYGHQPAIGRATPFAPASAYGESKLAAERGLEQMPGGIAIARLRVPILVGAGSDKLSRLVGLARRTGLVPAAPWPAPRSMLTYGALAGAVRRIIEQGLEGALFAADPEPFTAALLRDVARAEGRSVRLLRLPRPALALLRAGAPGLHSSLFLPNLLDKDDNLLAEAPEGERLRDAMVRMFRHKA